MNSIERTSFLFFFVISVWFCSFFLVVGGGCYSVWWGIGSSPLKPILVGIVWLTLSFLKGRQDLIASLAKTAP